MSETTIAAPLSGTEVIEAICAKVRNALRQDCFLSPMAAYESFEATVTLKVKMLDCGRIPEVHQTVTVQSEAPVNESDENFALEQAEIQMQAMPPNQVRRETDQAIPTLVDTGIGKPEIKHVKYAKKAPAAPVSEI